MPANASAGSQRTGQDPDPIAHLRAVSADWGWRAVSAVLSHQDTAPTFARTSWRFALAADHLAHPTAVLITTTEDGSVTVEVGRVPRYPVLP